MEPLASNTLKAEETQEAKAELAEARLAVAVADDFPGVNITDAAREEQEKKAKLERLQSFRALTTWAGATVIALIVAAVLELGLIQTVAEVTGGAAGEDVIDEVGTDLTDAAGAPGWFVRLTSSSPDLRSGPERSPFMI